MRKLLLFGGIALMLGLVLAYTANVSDAGAVPQDPLESVYESMARGYEEAAKKCAKEAYDLNLEMQSVRDTPFEFRGAAWGRLYVLLQVDYREKCRDYHYYLRKIQEARARIPKPTPTPTPTPASPDPAEPQPKPSPTSSPEKKIVEPPDELRNRLAKFLKEQEELKKKGDKLLKEINDNIKKSTSTKPKPPKPGYKAEFDSTSGLLIIKFTTPQGVLQVNLPDDMRAGDTISGTVVAEPNGQTNEERARNLENLNRYQLKVATETMTGPWGPFTWEWLKKIPKPQPSPSPLDKFPPQIAMPPFEGENVEMEIELIDLIAPVRMKLPEPPSDPPASSKMNLPTIGQNGRSVKIEGPFDGKVGTTQVRVGGQPVTVLAESPTSCIFKTPDQQVGPTEIVVTENNVETKGPYRNLGVRLNAPKTSLLKGEMTNVTIEVSGLDRKSVV